MQNANTITTKIHTLMTCLKWVRFSTALRYIRIHLNYYYILELHDVKDILKMNTTNVAGLSHIIYNPEKVIVD